MELCDSCKSCSGHEITDAGSCSFIRVNPGRGGIITAFNVGGKDILYLDNDLFNKGGDITAGGNPVLFPICSSLTRDSYVIEGKKYIMPGHGFAWALPWDVTDGGQKSPVHVQSKGSENSITLELRSNSHTHELYPFDFIVRLTYILNRGELLIKQQYENTGKREMPLYPGFHPYFSVGDKYKLKFEIDANKYSDYGEGNRLVEYKGEIDFNKPVDFVFRLNGTGPYSYSIYDPDLSRKIIIETAEDFKYMVMWTMKGKDFICLEPWMAGPDAMNTSEGLRLIAPGETLGTWIRIIVR